MINKKRLDILVHSLGLADSREKAKTLIMSGQIYVDNQKADKPGMSYPVNSRVELRGKKMEYVSRGGYKLEKAINKFKIDLKDKVCMDIGASTGGFTDCMLKNGAKKVYSIDVGYGQLDWKLRNNENVVNMERTNIRYLDASKITDEVNFFSVDVSFISLSLIFPKASEIVNENAKAVCLIKPQFEAGKGKVGKKGVVRDKDIHIEVIYKVINFALENGFSILGLSYSPIKGPEGNIEYLLYIEKESNAVSKIDISVKDLVEKSHIELNGGGIIENSVTTKH